MTQQKISNILNDDIGYVELLNMMPAAGNADLAIVNAARVSYLGESKGRVKDLRLLEYLMRNGHTSPFEMVEMQFKLYAPLVVWWQLVRHRTFNINMQSGRYTELGEDMYFPPQWRLQSKDNKQASDGYVDDTTNDYLTSKMLSHYEDSYRLYSESLEAGVAREMARYFLPAFNIYYAGIVKNDAHNLMRFFKLRLHDHAQYEIRQYAQAMYGIFKVRLPETSRLFEQYQLM